jgi:glutamate formiminotransferase/glutamate formiminotransferase/formiminotetrahydrofolate cyclodeaminase
VIVECVPNFSEGRDPNVIAAIARAVESAEGAWLLDTTSDPDHNRSVLTFAGNPESVARAAFAATHAALERIDLTKHAGVHPRVGAADVIPIVPICQLSLNDCAALARDLGRRIWNELRIPVFFYEGAAIIDDRRRLENVRRLARAGARPDIGEGRHATAGAVVIGAREFLIAWNINLRTRDVEFARKVAREIRESSGGLSCVKALGLRLESRGQTQVSINLTDFRRTPLHTVFDAVAERCRIAGIGIAGSELIGMIPEAALEASRGHDLRWLNLRPELVVERRLRELGTVK